MLPGDLFCALVLFDYFSLAEQTCVQNVLTSLLLYLKASQSESSCWSEF